MTALVLPDPKSITPAEIAHFGQQVEAAAAGTTDPHVVNDLSNRWAAITEYLRRTSTEGLKQAEATKIRLLARIAELTPKQPRGPKPHHGNPIFIGADKNSDPLPKDRMVEARKIAEHPDIVERVIEESTDADPPTKAKVIREIKTHQRRVEADKHHQELRGQKQRYESLNTPKHDPAADQRRYRLVTVSRDLSRAVHALTAEVGSVDQLEQELEGILPHVAEQWATRWNEAHQALEAFGYRKVHQ